MLRGIPKILSGDLLKTIRDMGHGDMLVIADAHFPSYGCGKRVVSALGNNAVEILEAILKLMPLDQYVDDPVSLMPLCGDDKVTPPIWAEIQAVVDKYNGKTDIKFVERFEFYEKTKNAYAVVATGEERQYGCIILKKGILREGEAV